MARCGLGISRRGAAVSGSGMVEGLALKATPCGRDPTWVGVSPTRSAEGYGTSRMETLVAYRLLLAPVMRSLSFGDESRAQRVASLATHAMVREETRRSLLCTFRRLLRGFLVMSGTMVANDIKAFVLHTNPRDEGCVHCVCVSVTPL